MDLKTEGLCTLSSARRVGVKCRFLSAPRDHRFAVVKKKARAAPLGMAKVCSIDGGLAQEFVGVEDEP
jgi:hypothetical protein